MDKKTVYIGSDHAGFALKQSLIEDKALGEWKFVDCGCQSEQSTDYPTYAKDVATHVAQGKGFGILVCGSGIGMAITANKVKGARAAALWSEESAQLSRQHNDANIVCVGSRLLATDLIKKIVKTFLTTPFEGGRHQRRVDLIEEK